jgi:NAD(P)-dependent dehydrogenase (short-subunit alcohol dehydrogenase family)
MSESFEGRKVVVVGGSSGMGLATAHQVIAGGGTAVITGRGEDTVRAAVEELSRHGKAWGIAGELTDRDQVPEIRRQLAADHADATLLVNAAGFFIPKAFSEYDEAFYDSYNELNRALFFITQTVVAGMVAGGRGGAIVNIGSMWALDAIATTPTSAYSAAQAGRHVLTKNLAIELAPENIRVNTVALAFVETPAYERFMDRETAQAVLDSVSPFHPLNRRGQPQDVT